MKRVSEYITNNVNTNIDYEFAKINNFVLSSGNLISSGIFYLFLTQKVSINGSDETVFSRSDVKKNIF